MVHVFAATVRSLFPVMEEESEPDYWLAPDDVIDFCHIGVQAVATGKEMLMTLYVEQPSKDWRRPWR